MISPQFGPNFMKGGLPLCFRVLARVYQHFQFALHRPNRRNGKPPYPEFATTENRYIYFIVHTSP